MWMKFVSFNVDRDEVIWARAATGIVKVAGEELAFASLLEDGLIFPFGKWKIKLIYNGSPN